MSDPVRVLYVSSEIYPYSPESSVSIVGRFLPQGVQERGREIRSFMPRYGTVNERRHQLHEVIRLSGMNIIVNDVDRPLIIKVASISSARMQVYFIDNEDFFHRKAVFCDADGNFFEDNDERAIFFARGVLETVKKLRWKPDIVHCQGWISHILPLYLKKAYDNDPIFTDSKIVLSLYDEPNYIFKTDLAAKIPFAGIGPEDVDTIKAPDGINLARLAIRYADGVIYGSKDVDEGLKQYVDERKLPVLQSPEISLETTGYIQEYNDFYEQILQANVTE
ncbi:MAG: glycogen/starch synthase [Bacteroidales bacterium]|jgi:starch synthase|nr:glycogen/starch synthase [Bacteroidales bacterium]